MTTSSPSAVSLRSSSAIGVLGNRPRSPLYNAGLLTRVLLIAIVLAGGRGYDVGISEPRLRARPLAQKQLPIHDVKPHALRFYDVVPELLRRLISFEGVEMLGYPVHCMLIVRWHCQFCGGPKVVEPALHCCRNTRVYLGIFLGHRLQIAIERDL